MTIKELVNLLQAIKIDYTTSYAAAMAERDEALKNNERDFRSDSPMYKPNIENIKVKFDKTIADLRISSMEKAMQFITEIREDEMYKAERIDTATLEKISALKDIPLTKAEILALKNKIGAKDYFGSRMLGVIAEKNGIPLYEVGVEANLEVKLGVLSALESQVDLLVRNWNPEAKVDREPHIMAIAALGDNTVDNLVRQYTNDVSGISEKSAVEASYRRILAAGSQGEKAILISNALRNAKGETKNRLLYRIATDNGNNISEYALALSGNADVIAEWRNGKAESYASAVKLVEDIAPIRDLSVVMQRIEEHSDNPFLDSMLKEAAKDSETIRTAISDSFVE